MDSSTLFSVGIALIFVGMLIAAVAFLLFLLFNIKGEGRVKGGGAIIVGPVPIVFGTDKESLKTVLLLAIVLTILTVMVLLMFHFVLR